MKTTTVSIARKKGNDDRLFGSVSNRDIAEALAAQNIEVDRKFIRLEEPIRTVGSHKVEVRFSAEVVVELTVNVVGI